MDKIKMFEDFVPVGFGSNTTASYSLAGTRNIGTGYNMDAFAGPALDETCNKVAEQAYAHEANDNPEHTKEGYVKEAKDLINKKIDEACESYGATNEAKNSPKEYAINELRKPKSWDTMFAMNAIRDYEAGKFDPENDASLAKWEKDYNGGVTPKPGFETYDIIAWALATGKKPDGTPIKESVSEAMVSVAGRNKPSGAFVLAKVIAEALVENGYTNANSRDYKKMVEMIQDVIMDSTF